MNAIKQFFQKHLSRAEIRLAVLMFVTPLTAFYLMQFAYSGGLPWEYSLNVLLANYLCIGLVHFTLCAITNYIALCSFITHLLACLWGIANHYVSLFRGTPILPWDFKALGTAMAVADSYRFSLDLPMVLSLVILAAMAFLLFPKIKTGRFRSSKTEPARGLPTFVPFCFVPIRFFNLTH